MSEPDSRSRAEDLREHPIGRSGIRCRNRRKQDAAVQLSYTGTSYRQTVPASARDFLALDEGLEPTIFVHPEVNAITFVYPDADAEGRESQALVSRDE